MSGQSRKRDRRRVADVCAFLVAPLWPLAAPGYLAGHAGGTTAPSSESPPLSTHVRMIAQQRLRMHGERIEIGEAFECSAPTAFELHCSSRARLADPDDLPRLIQAANPRTNGTPLRVNTR